MRHSITSVAVAALLSLSNAHSFAEQHQRSLARQATSEIESRIAEGQSAETIARSVFRMINGQRPPKWEKPGWAVAIKELDKLTCGGSLLALSIMDGSLISDSVSTNITHIITAGHCVASQIKDNTLVGNCIFVPTDAFKFGIGTWSQEFPGKWVESSSICLHSQYDPKTLDNDIALIRLDQKTLDQIPLTVASIHIPGKQFEPFIFRERGRVSAFGWGIRSSKKIENENPDLLRIDLPFIENQTCLKLANQSSDVHSTRGVFCAGFSNGASGICNGDSGSGAVFKPQATETAVNFSEAVLMGIASWREWCGKESSASIFTDLRSHREWLHEAYSQLDKEN